MAGNESFLLPSHSNTRTSLIRIIMLTPSITENSVSLGSEYTREAQTPEASKRNHICSSFQNTFGAHSEQMYQPKNSEATGIQSEDGLFTTLNDQISSLIGRRSQKIFLWKKGLLFKKRTFFYSET